MVYGMVCMYIWLYSEQDFFTLEGGFQKSF